MPRPKAYEPEDGYKYQILTRNPQYGRAWEHCDYAESRQEKNYLIGEYRLAYGGGFEFKSILLPRRYWPKHKSTLVETKVEVVQALVAI